MCSDYNVPHSLWVIETLILHFHIAAWNKSHCKNKSTPSLHGYFVLLLSSWELICNETNPRLTKESLLLSASFKRDKGRLLDMLPSLSRPFLSLIFSSCRVCEVKITSPENAVQFPEDEITVCRLDCGSWFTKVSLYPGDFRQLGIVKAVINTGIGNEANLSAYLPYTAVCCPTSCINVTVNGAAP